MPISIYKYRCESHSLSKKKSKELATMAELLSKVTPSSPSQPKLVCDSTDDSLHIPQHYVRPPNDRPILNELAFCDTIPVIDLSLLNGPARLCVIQRIGLACEQDGFFQIVNHGVPEAVINDILEVAKVFFTMPPEYRHHYYSEDSSRAVRLSTSFNVEKEEVFNWRDFLRLHCYPLEDYMGSWPSQPPAFREVVGRYCTEIRSLVLRLLAAISGSLGLEPDFFDKALGKHAQHMAINYYPKCPNPELTFGLPGHSDPNLLTVLLQGDVSGLQALKDGRWVAVDPIPNAFVVNVGDQLQVLSNGMYKSVIHRAVVNASQARISIPTFYSPSPETQIGPALQLINGDTRARYRKFAYQEYYHHFWNKCLDGKTCLNNFTIDDSSICKT